MKLDPSIFKAYDIRGVYETHIDAEGFVPVVRAIITFFHKNLNKDNPTILLARDMRIGSPALYDVALEQMKKSGIRVIDAGLLPTPTFYFGVLANKYDAGILITASHNPSEYAGTKFVLRDGEKIIKIGADTGMKQIKELALAGDESKFTSYANGGMIEQKTDILEQEIQAALEGVDVSALKPLKIAADPANGMGGLYIEELFKHIPGEVTYINKELDGSFPAHQADPLDFKNLEPLQSLVKETGSDVGLEPDGDGDRIFFIDENAQVVPATMISGLMAKQTLARTPGARVIVDIRYTENVSNVVKKYGGKTSISKVGHAFISKQVNDEGATFAGESSGHFFFGVTGGAESAVKVILNVLIAISIDEKGLSNTLKELHTSHESGELNFVLPEGVTGKQVQDSIAKTYETSEISWLDGVSVDYGSWRANIRTSNTEPLLRLNVEAQSKELMEDKFDELKKLITKMGGCEKTSSH